MLDGTLVQGLPPVEMSVSGPVPQRHRDRTVEEVAKALESVGVTALHLRVRIDLSEDPARERPASIRVVADVRGRPIRVHVAAATLEEVIDLAGHRLRDRVNTAIEHRRAVRRRVATRSGSWHHGDLPSARPTHHPLPAAEREVVRRKTFTTADASIDEAIHDLESLDHDFFLFTEVDSAQDAVVQRVGDGTYRVGFLDSAPTAVVAAADVAIDPASAPSLLLEEAQARLDATGDPFIFFADPVADRGRVLYRRYDGHYGLITPA